MSQTSNTRRRRRRLIPALAAIAVSTALTVDTGPAAVVHAGPSGTDAPAGNLAGWRQIFVDNFTTNVARGNFPSAVSSKWDAYPSPWRDTSGKGVYSPKDVVYISNGVLTKDIHTAGGVHKIAALTPKLPGSSSYGQLYGRYEVRMRSDVLPGYKVAWMLWPDSGTVTTGAVGGGGNGEIDYPEGDLHPGDVIWAFMHRQNATYGGDQAWFRIPVNLTGWHTYTIEWSPGLVRFLLDGAEVGRTTERIPNTRMHWVLQTETSIKAATADSTRGNVQIDWVAAWAYDTSISAPVAGDTAGPTVSLAAPAPGATVAGVVNLAANASDPAGVTAVKWYVDGVEVKHDGGAPWAAAWDSRSVGNGQHRIFVKARDGKGNWSTSSTQGFVVAN